MRVLAMAMVLCSPLVCLGESFNFEVTSRAVDKGAVELTAVPKTGLHFNLKAPNRLEFGEPANVALPQTSAREKFVYTIDKPQAGGKLSLFTCDDHETFCVKQTARWSFNEGGSIALASDTAQEPVTAGPAPAKKVRESHGFLLNEMDEAMRRAEKEKKPILIDFSAIWCPACLKLEHDVLESPEFQKVAHNFIKVRIDLDWEGQIPYTKKYHVRDVPTLVLTNEKGDQLARVHGYRPKTKLVAELQAFIKSKPESVVTLKERADQGDRNAADRFGLIAYDSQEYSTAMYYWSGTEVYKDRLLIAEVNSLSELEVRPADKSMRLITKLEQAVQNFPDSVDLPAWQLQLAELYQWAKKPDKMKVAAHAAIHAAEHLLDQPDQLKEHLSMDSSRDDLVLQTGDLWAYKARAQTLLGDTTGSRESWKSAIAETTKHIKGPEDKGRKLLLIRYLRESGNVAAIDPVLKELQEQFPDEYTFYYKRASLMVEQSKFADAEPLAREALNHSYGSNRASSAVLLAQILKKQKKPDQAKAVAQSALEQIEVPSDKTSNLYHKLEELRRYL